MGEITGDPEELGHFDKEMVALNRRPNCEFTFSDCRYDVDTSNGTKEILKGISATVKSGEVLAIMGPSGAGKTMMMNLLTLAPGPGVRYGRVTLNGQAVTLDKFKRFCSVVPQHDDHWAYLTCRETIELAAELQLTTGEEKESLVNTLLKEMGLVSCQNTRVGNIFLQGLSGGQKRRLSLAVALVKKPSMIFLDEPTSGLDAAAAASIMTFFKQLAVSLNLIIVCTIHQPSSKVFHGFDTTMVLTGGQLAYFGPAQELTHYLKEIDRPVPENSNPAEHVLDLVNREFVDSAEVDYMIDAWNAYYEKAKLDEGSNQFGRYQAIQKQIAGEVTDLPPLEQKHLPFLPQVLVLLKRHGILVYRDPILYLGRGMAFLMACTFFSIVYINARKRNQEQAIYKIFLFMWHIGVPTCLGVVAVFSYNMEHFSIRREVKSGMYSPVAYLMSNFLLQIPLMIVLAVLALMIGGYVVSLYHIDMCVQMLGLYALTIWSFECMAHLLGVQFANPLIGMLGFMCLWFSSFLFAGVMVPEDDVIWPFKLFVYIFPFRWFLASAMYTDFHDTTFDGAIPDALAPKGYSCPGSDDSTLACYGYTGKQVLDSLGVTYKSFSSDDNVLRDAMYILAIAMFYKIGTVALVIYDCHASQAPKDPKARAPTKGNKGNGTA